MLFTFATLKMWERLFHGRLQYSASNYFRDGPCVASCPLICHQLPPVFCEVFASLLTVAQQKVSSCGAQITVEPVRISLMETFLLQTLLHSFYLSHKTSSVWTLWKQPKALFSVSYKTLWFLSLFLFRIIYLTVAGVASWGKKTLLLSQTI